MSFTLIDLKSRTNEFPTSVWNWRVAVAVIRDLNVIDEFQTKRMLETASGVKIETAEAHAIGNKIREVVLPKLSPNKRIFENLTITDEPDDGTFYGHGEEVWRNYSAGYRWMEDFADFCLRSEGFEVF